MALFGPYETVEDLPSRPWVQVSTARRTGEQGRPDLIVKASRVIIGFDSPEVTEQRRRDLLSAAAVQDRVGRTARWVAVRETSSAPSSTFVVLDRYDRSAADLGKQRRLTRAELRSVAMAVLEGLSDLREECGRGHGRLHASNVMLRQKGSSAVGEVALTDPAPQGPEWEAQDLHDFGLLIRQLATGFEDRAGEPPAAAWGALGNAGAFWKDLCAELIALGPADEAPDLAALRKRIKRDAPRDSKGRGPLLGALAAIALLAASAGAWWFLGRGESLPSYDDVARYWATACVESDGWFGGTDPVPPFEGLVADRLARAGITSESISGAAGGYVRELAGEWTRVRALGPADGWAEVRFDMRDAAVGLPRPDRPWRALRENDFRSRVEAVHDALVSLRGMLDGAGQAAGWSLRSDLASARVWMEQRGWAGGLGLIDETLRSIDPTPSFSAEVGRYEDGTRERVSGAIADGAILAASLADLSDSWGRAEAAAAALEDIDQSGDPVLSRARELLPSLPSGETWDLASVVSLAAAVRSVLPSLQAAVAFTESDVWGRVDAGLLASEQARPGGGASPATLLETWLASAAEYERLSGPSPVRQMIEELDAERAWLAAYMEESESSGDASLASLAAELDGLRSGLESVDLPWIRKHETRLTNEASARAGGMRSLIDRVAAYKKTPAELAQELLAIEWLVEENEPEPLHRYWIERRTEWIEGLTSVEAGVRLPTYAVERSRFQLAGSFEEILDRFGPLTPPAIPGSVESSSITTAYESEYQALLESTLATVGADWRIDAFELSDEDRASLDQIERARADWRHSAERMMDDLDGAYTRLVAFEQRDAASGTGESIAEVVGGWQGSAVYAALDGDRSFAKLRALWTALDGVDAADRPALIEAVSRRSTEPQAAYAAWLRLGWEGLRWPSTSEEMRAALAVRDDPALAAVADAMRDEARRRWSAAARAMAARTDWPELERAFGLMTEFGADLAAEPAAMRLNFALYSLRAGLADADDEAVAEALRGFEGLSSSLGSEGLSIAAEFAQMRANSEDGVDLARLAASGPGGLPGWRGETPNPIGDPTEDGKILVFTGPGGLRIECRLVDSGPNPQAGGEERLVYLGTSEVSIALASWALSASGGTDVDWPELRREATGDGVRPWTADGRGLAAKSNPSDWFTWPDIDRERRDKFAVDTSRLFEAGSPGDLPIQLISYRDAGVLASRLGCRLPTAREWRLALEGAVPKVGEVNLRGAEFSQQRDFVLGLRQGGQSQMPFPDENVFYPDRNTPRGDAAADGNSPDRVLFFRAVGGSGGFENMLGNVAEWVSEGGQPRVIGGSALSHPAQRADLAVASPVPMLGRRGAGDERDRTRAFADVGFRLGLEIPGSLKPSLARLLSAWFDEAPRYVAVTE